MRILMTLLVLLNGLLTAQTAGPALSATLKAGDMAPDFTLPATNGRTVKLADFRGKKAVVLAFFPAAFTGGCTKEMQTYQLGIDKFRGAEAEVFGISTDLTPSQREFATKLNLDFQLLSDFVDRKVTEQYGVLVKERGVARRVTFVIDKEGKIAHIEGDKDAVETSGALQACSRLNSKKSD